MLRFDWYKIEFRSKKKLSNFNNILYWITFKELPYSQKDPVFRWSGFDFLGHSYLINPEALFIYKYSNFGLQDMYDYVYLASLRNFAEYKITGDTSLPIEHCSFPESRINRNNLLKQTKEKIIFKFEENKNGIKFR